MTQVCVPAGAQVLDLLEDCCEGLLQHIAKERQLAARSAA